MSSREVDRIVVTFLLLAIGYVLGSVSVVISHLTTSMAYGLDLKTCQKAKIK